MRSLLLYLLIVLTASPCIGQTKKEKARQFVDNLVSSNNQLFAYTKGDFSISDQGAMNYGVPIVCVQGAAGMTPRLSFTYNSNAGSGILGEGWSLSGLSIITRTSQNFVIDGKNGRIEFNDNDRILLDGQRLLNTDNSASGYWPDASTNTCTYFTEQNNFKQVVAYYTNNRVTRFEVRTKDGLLYHYGATGDKQSDIDKGYFLKSLADNNQIISWLLVRIEDLNQNVIDFEYDKTALAKSFVKPTLVKYTGIKSTPGSYFAYIKFLYEKVPVHYKYINGQRIQFDEILRSVVCEYKDATSVPNSTIRTYKINYHSLPEQNKYYIKEILECINNNDCLQTTFQWQSPNAKLVAPASPTKIKLGKTLTEDYQIYTGDFNGDGLLDNVNLKILASKISFFFCNNKKGKFDKAKEIDLPASVDSTSKVIINDFDANGTSDIAFCWMDGNKFKFQVAYLPEILNGKDISTPKLGNLVAETIDSGVGKNELFYSSNDFNGDGLQDMYCYYYKAQSVKLVFAINSKSNQFTVKPVKTVSTIFSNGTARDTIPDNLPINLGDYNSDGITDLLFTWINSKGWNIKSFLLNDNLLPLEQNSKLVNTEKNEITPLNFTLSESKKTKIIIDSTEVEVDSLVSVRTSSYQLYKNENLPITKAVYTLDINHDGNSDLLVSYQNDKGWKTWVLLGKGNGEFEPPTQSEIDDVNYKYIQTQSFGDFNGDGQIDICISYSNETGWYIKPTYGYGNGRFARSADLVRLDSSNFSYTIKQQVKGMLNLDGFVKSFPEVSEARLKKYNNNEAVPAGLLNNIDGTVAFFANKIWSNKPVPTSSFGATSTEYFNNYVFTDKPKDFGEDLSSLKRIHSISPAESNKITITRNKIHSINSAGDPLCFEAMENKSINEFANVKFIDYWKPIIADLNGDGITDFALTYSRQPEPAAVANALGGEQSILLVLNQAKKSGRIAKIILGNGADIQVEYANTTELGGFDTSSLSLSYPNTPYNIPLSVVKSTKSPNGIGAYTEVVYGYKNGIMGLTGRGFMGFEKSFIHSAVANSSTYKYYLIDSVFLNAGILPLNDVQTFINNKLTNHEQLKNALFTEAGSKVVFNFIESKISKAFDLTGELISANESNFEYDKFGNLTKSETRYPDTQINLIRNEYYETSIEETDEQVKKDNLSRWIIGRLKSTTIHKAKGSDDQVTRKSEFEYYPVTGQLKLEKTLVGTHYEIHKKYYYDARGNKIKEESIPAKNKTDIATTQYDYDNKHQRFLIKKTDALNYSVTYKPNIIYGFNEEITDANGNTSKINFASGSYDPFGRKKKITLPDGNWTSEANYKCISCNTPNAVYFKISSSSVASTPVITFYDVLDRPVKTISFDINYNRVSKIDVFNEKGQLTKSSNPYFEAIVPGAAVVYTVTEFDEAGRAKKITNPDGTVNRMEYLGLKTVVINNKGQKNITINDLYGRKAIGIDNRKDSIRYQYNLDGNITEITDQANRAFTSRFDKDLGKIISSFNPNIGYSTSYSYNHWGDVEEIKSGYLGNNLTNFVYDKLGRVKSRIERKSNLGPNVNAPDNKIEDKVDYEYVQSNDPANGKGKLKSIKVTGDQRKLSKSFEYDRLGRLTRKLFGFDNFVGGAHGDADIKTAWSNVVGNGKTADIKYSYNTLGQVETITYPKLNTINYKKEFVVKYEYENGMAKTVSGNGKKLWEYIEGNADGTTAQVGFNQNKTISSFTYNSLNQNLETIGIVYNDSTRIQQWNYEYDDLNNITFRADVINSPTSGERYDYDDLNRIKTVTNNNVQNQYRYDKLGNIIYRSDLGHYRQRDSYQPNELSKERKITINKDSLNSIKNDEGLSSDRDDVEYYYDLVGNRYKKELNEKVQFEIQFNHFNKPDEIHNRLTNVETSFFYDEDNNLQIEVKGNTRKFYIDGLFEFEYKQFSNSFQIAQKFFVAVNGSLVAYNEIENTTTNDNFFFVHKDVLGSVTAITNEQGSPSFFAYDIWGKRLDPKTWKPASTGFTKGYTGHQHWDDLRLINMGGRLFDPEIGQFLQVDPILNLDIPSLGLTAYSYCYQNPLYYSDPSGYLFGKIGRAIGNVFRDPGRAILRGFIGAPIFGSGSIIFSNMPGVNDFIDKNAGTIVMIEVSIAMMAIGAPPVAAGFATGFSSAFSQTYLNGGSFSQGLEAGLKSGVISAVTAGITQGIGDLFMGTENTAGLFGDNVWANYTGKAVTHAAFQGAMNEAQGGNFWDGALPALVSSAGDPLVGQVGGYDLSSRMGRTALSATIGGTASVLGGGKFANGAVTASIVHMYNFEAHYIESGGSRYPAGEKVNCAAPPEQIEKGYSFGQNFLNVGPDGSFQIQNGPLPLGVVSPAVGVSRDACGRWHASLGVGAGMPGVASASVGINMGARNGVFAQACYFGVCGQVNVNMQYKPAPADRLPIGPKW